jgi:hypothetical protein
MLGKMTKKTTPNSLVFIPDREKAILATPVVERVIYNK